MEIGLTPKANEIISDIYDAVLDPAKWDHVGAKLCCTFDASSFLLAVQRRKERDVALLKTNWPAEQLQTYASYFYNVDCWMEEGLRQPEMTPLIGGRYLPDREFIKHELYNDFARPNGIRHLLAEWSIIDGGAQCSLALHRSARSGEFDTIQARCLGELFPHILRSIRFGAVVSGARHCERLCENTLNELSAAIVVVDQHGVVVLANRAAEKIASARDGFTLAAGPRDRMVAAATSDETKRLRHMIAKAAPGGAEPAAGGSMRLMSITGQRGYALTAIPLPEAARGLHIRPDRLVLLVITDLSAAARPPERQLSEVFGLTPAEARLVASLARGMTRSDYADEAGIASLTVKTHLARAFAKLGVNRESELVRLALSLIRP